MAWDQGVYDQLTREGYTYKPLEESFDRFVQRVQNEKAKAQDAGFFENLRAQPMPDFSGIVDANGNLLDQYKLGPASENDALGLIKDKATQVGDSPWAQLMMQLQGVEQQGAGDANARRSNAALSSAYSDLATRGGLRSGARERLATKGMRDFENSRADVSRQGVLDRLGIRTKDEDTKSDFLKSYGNLSESAAGRKDAVSRANLASILGNKNAENEYNLGKYKTGMDAWAADRQARATEESGKK